MKKHILITVDDSIWPEIEMSLFIYDDSEKHIRPRLTRVSLYDTAFANFEVHSSNAMREVVGQVVSHGKEHYGKGAHPVETPRAERPKGHEGVRERNAPQRKQARAQGDNPVSGLRDRKVRRTQSQTPKTKVSKRR